MFEPNCHILTYCNSYIHDYTMPFKPKDTFVEVISHIARLHSGRAVAPSFDQQNLYFLGHLVTFQLVTIQTTPRTIPSWQSKGQDDFHSRCGWDMFIVSTCN